MKVAAYGAPPKFFEYLWQHDSGEMKFDLTGQWVSGEDANVIVVVAKDSKDVRFLPATLLPAFNAVTTTASSHYYDIPKNVFNGTLNSDVHIFLEDGVVQKFSNESFSEEDIRGLSSCLISGMLNLDYTRTNEAQSYKEILHLCKKWAPDPSVGYD